MRTGRGCLDKTLQTFDAALHELEWNIDIP